MLRTNSSSLGWLASVFFIGMGCAAQAQFGIARPLDEPFNAGGPSRLGRELRALTTASLYPYAHFDFSRGSAIDGGLLDIDTSFTPKNSRKSFGIGSWYWRNYKGGANIYELHANAYFTPEVGVQVGYLSTSKGGSAFDVFALYRLTSRKYAPHARHSSIVQVGVGPFIDNSGNHTATNFTGFLSASMDLVKRFSVNASYWYGKDQVNYFNRIAIGAGYRF